MLLSITEWQLVILVLISAEKIEECWLLAHTCMLLSGVLYVRTLFYFSYIALVALFAPVFVHSNEENTEARIKKFLLKELRKSHVNGTTFQK